MKDVEYVKPSGLFTNYIYKAIPLAFDESMSYYETLAGILALLKNSVIPTINNNADLLKELEDYVNHYFDNLDVQQEINNKLDDMAESGQLTEIIAQYLELAGILAFNTKADLKNAQNLVNGSFTKTYGTTTYNDGYGYFYKIRELLNTDVIDDDNLLALANYPLLVAEKIPDSTISSILTNITTITTKVGNLEDEVYKLDGKKIQILGDSMSDPNLLDNSWPTYLAQKGAVITNRSVSGMRISQTDGWADKVDELTGDFDINIVFCGVNDSSSNVEIGNKYSDDLTTFCGSVDYLFSKMVEKWPNAINYVILPVKTLYENGYNIGELKLYNFILYLYAQKYNFLVMNLYRTAPMLNPHVTTYKNLYQSDGLHPTALYQPILAETIIDYLVNLKSDDMGSEIIDVSNCVTSGATFSYKSLQMYLTTDKMIHFQFYGTCANTQIYNQHVWLGEMKNFLWCANSLPLANHAIGTNNYEFKVNYNNKDLEFYIYDSPAGDVTMTVNGDWYGWFLP